MKSPTRMRPRLTQVDAGAAPADLVEVARRASHCRPQPPQNAAPAARAAPHCGQNASSLTTLILPATLESACPRLVVEPARVSCQANVTSGARPPP